MTFPLDFSQYELQQLIGRGATSEVFVAKCKSNGVQLAMKVIDLESCPIEIEHLRREVAFWSRSQHSNVVNYFGSFVNGSVLYIMMEYMSGGSVYEIMRFAYPRGFQDESQIAIILREVLKALAYFHENKQIHRDIKAGNVLMNDQGEIKIGDFGISADMLEQGQRKRARYTVIGTPCYMAPEVLNATHGYSEKADIWSLGITAIELALGSAPYSNLYPVEVIVRITNNPPPSLPDDGHFSSAFKDFVKCCLHKDPTKRSTAHELLNHKFVKTSKSTSELARSLLTNLPPLFERFEVIHKAQASSKDQDKSKQGPIVEWDFCDIDAAKMVNEKEEPVVKKEKVKKVGKFTITTESTKGNTASAQPQQQQTKATNPQSAPTSTLAPSVEETEEEQQQIARMDKEITFLKQKMTELQDQNDKFMQMISDLTNQVKLLMNEKKSA